MESLAVASSVICRSPVGYLLLTREGDALTGLHFIDNDASDGDWPLTIDRSSVGQDEEAFSELLEQLDEYFSGQRKTFQLSTLSIRLDGTEFQTRVWKELCRIPYGQTISYGELARRLGKPTASRAVGLANGRNPISILVPCHRVIGANGKLVGYGGGLHRKQKLLETEAKHL